MKILAYIAIIFITQIGFTQSDIYLGGCCDKNGKPKNPGDHTLNAYHVKKHTKTLTFELNIESVTLGNEKSKIDVHFKGKINCETPILNINDSLGIKIVIGKTTENDLNKFLYKVNFYRMDENNNCWKSSMLLTSFFEVFSQTLSLNMFAVGAEGEDDYFRIDSGWMKIN